MQTTNLNIVLCSVQEDLVVHTYIAMQSLRLNEQRFFATTVTQVLAMTAVILNFNLLSINVASFSLSMYTFFLLDI